MSQTYYVQIPSYDLWTSILDWIIIAPTIEFIEEETNPEIPLNSEGDSKNLEDELFELARLKLWSSGVPPSSIIEKNDKTVEENQRALEPLTLFEPSTSEKGSELKRDKIEKWAIAFQRAWNWKSYFLKSD